MAKNTVIRKTLTSLSEPWCDQVLGQSVDIEDIEIFLKKQLGSKIGYAIIPQTKDTDGYYHLWGFADQAAYNDYMTDSDANAALRLVNVAIPLLEEQGGVSNIVRLTRISSGSLVTNKPIASVEVSYLWQQYNPITQETTDQDEDATIVVACRTQNANGAWGTWDSSKEFTVSIQSGQTKTIDLSQLLTSDATYQVRLVATGETSGISASPVTMTIIYSNVNVTYDGSIATAYQGSNIQLPFRIAGSVQKQLRIKINGYTKNYSLGTTTYTDNTYGAVLTQTEFALTRGATKAEAWIAFGDNYAAETEHIEFQFIYLPEGDTATTPILAVTDIVPEFENWTRLTIFNYAIYNPAATETDLIITFLDKNTGQVYIRREQTCINGEAYSFDENFAMEYAGDEQPTVINAQAIFTDALGATYGNTINFTVDNTENFAPTKGANLIVSAEKKAITIDGVEYELHDLLTDAADTNSGWKSNSETDSTGAIIDVPVLSIGAGNRFTLPYELFDANTGHNIDGVEGSITMEFDIKVKNIVGDAAIIDASSEFSSAYTGLKFYPTRAVCLSRNNYTEELCDLHYHEEVREHVAINIIRNLRGEGMNLVRIFINGKSNRSIIYNDEDAFIPIGSEVAQSIVIGSDEADVDIYGIRIYKGQQLGAIQIQNDYMAGMPTIEDKKRFKKFNAIYNGTEISYDQCNALGLNTLLRKIPAGGHYPSRENQSKQKGVSLDVRIYSERGNAASLDTKHSGTFVGLTIKGQGTSAMGYYWWNITDGFEDDVEISAEEYDATNPTHYEDDGSYYKKVTYFNSLDGVSQVYASEYEIEDGRGGITKLVGKANYASPMQSHKLGGIWAYDELWQILVNNGSDGRPIFENTHACCYEKPFLNFYQIGNETPVFCGFQTWGSGKGDKKTFGYNKKKSPGYLCVSGADNGAIAALFQMPWIVSKNADGAWTSNIYPKSVTINTGDIKNGYCYKNGASDVLSFEVEIGSKYDGGETVNGVLRIEDEAKGETETTLYTTFAEFANFIVGCSPFLKPYAGTEAQLIADSANLIRDHQYWLFNSSTDRYNVYYYNPATGLFERTVQVPTAWGSDGRAYTYGSPKLTEQLAGITITVNTVNGKQSMTLEEAMDTLGTSDMNVLNECFIQARVALFAAHASAYIDIPDVVFHQAFVKMDALTDNRTKNVYPWIDPAIDKLVRLKQDDVDTGKKTDNQGRQTKPYYVLEHTKAANGSNYWNGENNVLFTLVERAFDGRIRNMMRDMFTTMAQISGSVDNYFHDRYYWVQEYFPAVAYNETNRVLYETAQVKLMNGLIDVSQDPITQAIGDQLECEKQFMDQRLPMLMSWCEYETGGDGTLSFRSVNTVSGQSPTYEVEYTAYQYIYPKLAIGGTMAALYAKVNGEWVNQGGEPYLCAPGETVRLIVSTDSNTQFTLRWMHYAKSIGNLGSLPCGEDGNVTITGKRLRKLECWAEDGTAIEFHPKGITISNCRNLEEVNFTNASALSGTFAADLPRLQKLKLRGSAYTNVSLPKTSTLTEVILPSSINAITVDGQPQLATLSVDELTNLRTLKIVGEHKIQKQTQTIVQLAYTQATNLNSVQLENITWTAFGTNVLIWLQELNAHLTGTINVSGNLTFANKVALVGTYGNIDSSINPLYIAYTKRNIASITIKGLSYIETTGEYDYDIVCSPTTGNNVGIKNGKLDIKWELEDTASNFAAFTDTVEGILNVSKLDSSDTDTRYTATCTLTNIDGGKLTSDIQIGFYRRIPKIGDWAYADGTFDDQLLKGRTAVGIIYKMDEMWQGADESEPTIFTGYDKPTDAFKENRTLVGYVCHIDASKNVPYRSTNGNVNTSSVAWGLYPSSDSNGVSDLQTEIGEATGITSIFDLSSVANITSRGLDGGSDNTYLTTDNYIDDNEEDGFKDYSETVNVAVNDWKGKQKTKAIVDYATYLINAYLLSEGNESVAMSYTDSDGVEHTIDKVPETLEELANAMDVLYAANNNLSKYRQFLYPAAFGCYLYEPTVNEGEELDPQYAKGNWFLVDAGALLRQFSFFAKSRTGGMGATYTEGQGTTPNRSVIDKMIKAALNDSGTNEIKSSVDPSHVDDDSYTNAELAAINRYFHSMVEAEKPIYAMAEWRALVTGNTSPFTQHSTGSHWSSTEGSSIGSWYVYFSSGASYGNGKSGAYVVRPAVAYRFNL